MISASQIQTATLANEDYVRNTGSSRGAAWAAYQALDTSKVNWDTFKNYLTDNGLTPYGQGMLSRRQSASRRRGSSNAG